MIGGLIAWGIIATIGFLASFVCAILGHNGWEDLLKRTNVMRDYLTTDEKMWDGFIKYSLGREGQMKEKDMQKRYGRDLDYDFDKRNGWNQIQ